MKFTLTIPDPSIMRAGKEDYVGIKAGTEIHRVHQTGFGATGYNGTNKGDARFSPIYDPSGKIIPTIYGGETFECATCEIILRCPDTPKLDPKTGLPPLEIIHPSDYALYSHSVVRTNVDLNLVDLRILGQRKIGVHSNLLLAGPKSTYPATRGWAEQIHAKCPTAQGLYYTSFQCGPNYAVVLFGDRIAAGGLDEISTRLVADKPCHNDIAALASTLSIEYQDV